MKEMFEKTTMVLLQADEEAAALNKERFAALGFDVLGSCQSGADAVRVLCEMQPDIVLMDSFLPGRSAQDILEALKEVPVQPRLRLQTIPFHVQVCYGHVS